MGNNGHAVVKLSTVSSFLQSVLKMVLLPESVDPSFLLCKSEAHSFSGCFNCFVPLQPFSLLTTFLCALKIVTGIEADIVRR